MDNDIVIDFGDTFTVSSDCDGYPAVRIENTAFVEAPRWLRFPSPGHDTARLINDLITALTELRDAKGETP